MAYNPVDGDLNFSSQDDALNTIFDTIAGWFVGTSAPSSTRAFQKWVDSSDARYPLKVRDKDDASWKILWYLVGSDCGPVVADNGTDYVQMHCNTLTDSYEFKFPAVAGAAGESLNVATRSGTGTRADPYVMTMQWVSAGSSGVSAIDDLSDVDTTTTTPSTNDVLTWTGSVWEPAAGGGGGGNAFDTIDVPNGTDPLASASDTLVLTSADSSITITGTASTDTVDFVVDPANVDHNALQNYDANEHPDITGSVTVTGAWTFARNATNPDMVFRNDGTGGLDISLDGDVLFAGTNDVRLTATDPAADRTITIPDPGGNASILFADVDQTPTGVFTFDPDTGSDKIFSIINGGASGTHRHNLLVQGNVSLQEVGGTFAKSLQVGSPTQTTAYTIPEPASGATATVVIEERANVFTENQTVDAHLIVDNENELRLTENGGSYVALTAAAALASNYTLTFPSSAPAAGQILESDGSGNLSWLTTPGGGGATSIIVQHDDATVDSDIDTFDFGAGLDVTESPENEANITLKGSMTDGSPDQIDGEFLFVSSTFGADMVMELRNDEGSFQYDLKLDGDVVFNRATDCKLEADSSASARTWTLPNLGGTIALLNPGVANTQTFTAPVKFSPSSVSALETVFENQTDVGNPDTARHNIHLDGNVIFDLGDAGIGGTTGTLKADSGLAANTEWTLPDQDGTLAIVGDNPSNNTPVCFNADIASSLTYCVQNTHASGSYGITAHGNITAGGANGGGDVEAVRSGGAGGTLKATGDSGTGGTIQLTDGTNGTGTFQYNGAGSPTWTLPNTTDEMTCIGNNTTGTGDIVRAASSTISGSWEHSSGGRIVYKNQAPIRFEEGAGTNYVGIRGPASSTTDYTLTLPAAAPATGDSLVSSSGSTLDWEERRKYNIEMATVIVDDVASSQEGGFFKVPSQWTNGLTFQEVQVYCEGGTSCQVNIERNGTDIMSSDITASAGTWTTSTTFSTTTASSGDDIRWALGTETGTVTRLQIVLLYSF